MTRSKDTLYLPALTEYREAAAKRRAEAFCDVSEYVLGTEVRPLTPATFSMLYALRSAFLFNFAKVGAVDVLNYIWLHSPEYCHTGIPGWKRRKRKALRRFLFELTQPWRKWIGMAPNAERYNAVLNIAISEIRQKLEDAFADAPSRSGRPGKPVATMEAFLIHEFAVAYRWEPERTRNMPLRKLLQLHRCIRADRGESLSDDGEDAVLAAHMQAKQDEFDAKEKAKANHV